MSDEKKKRASLGFWIMEAVPAVPGQTTETYKVAKRDLESMGAAEKHLRANGEKFDGKTVLLVHAKKEIPVKVQTRKIVKLV